VRQGAENLARQAELLSILPLKGFAAIPETHDIEAVARLSSRMIVLSERPARASGQHHSSRHGLAL